MKQMINIADRVYLVNRIIKEHNLPVIDDWKQLTRSDIAFKKDGLIFLCNEVQDVEEIIETNIKPEEVTL